MSLVLFARRYRLTLVYCLVLLNTPTSLAQYQLQPVSPANTPIPYSATDEAELQLPDLGDPASSLFSLEKEYQLGRAWLKALRGQVATVDDPLLQDYLENLSFKLASYSELRDRRLDVIVINNKTINAFAVPGGVIGVHNGLLLHAQTEAQLASVLAHELAHISQRHFARSIEAQKRNTLPTMAGLLAGIILAATAGGDSGMAAIAATQAASLQNQLRYSRLHEQEADRKGMQTLVKANMDPNATAAMFDKMQQLARYAGTRPPEFLLTHPVTESRISDARNRARQYPRKMYTDSLRFKLMQARIELALTDNSIEAEKRFRARLDTEQGQHDADHYGLVLALIANQQFDEAQRYLQPLLKAVPNEICYLIAAADIFIGQQDYDQAISLLDNYLLLAPNNHPVTMNLATALLKANQPHKAETLLKQHSQNRPNDPAVWYLLAESQGLAGNIIGVHMARAEYFVLTGALDRAIRQLGYALPLVEGNHLTSTRIKTRMQEIKEMEAAIKAL